MAGKGIKKKFGQSITQHHHRQISYGTFIPFFTVDSEYLRSLLADKGSELELPESASSHNSHNHFPPEFSRQTSVDRASDTSSSEGSLVGTFASTNRPRETTFFKECELQIRKLFTFMELHLSKVESDLEGVCLRPRGNQNEPSVESSTKGYFSESSSSDEEPSKNSIDSGIEDDHMRTTIGLLHRLKEVVLSLQQSFNHSFSCLDELVDMHDNRCLSKDGRNYLDTKDPHRKDVKGRIDAALTQIDSHLQTYEREQEIRIDGLGRILTESQATAQVRGTRVSCFTPLTAFLFVAMCGTIAYMYYFDHTDNWVVLLRLVRGPLLVVFYLYLLAINMKGWAAAYIDYVTIFDYPPNGTPMPKFVFKVAGMFTVLFGVFIISLLIVSPFSADILRMVLPLVMWLFLLAYLFNPVNVHLRRGRWSFILVVVRVLSAPFFFVYFGDFWFADQLNSTVAILLDFQYFTCYIATASWGGPADKSVCTSSGNGIRPVLSCLPALWRFFQCLRCYYDTRKLKHLINAGKYSTTFPVVVFAALFSIKVARTFSFSDLDFDDVGWIIVCWFVASFVHALYTFLWDIYCDWGLWQIWKGTLLRPKLLFRYKCFYFLAIVSDFFLRFAWAIKLTLAVVWQLDSDVIYTGLVVGEILRRFVWNFFRVELEQVCRMENCN